MLSVSKQLLSKIQQTLLIAVGVLSSSAMAGGYLAVDNTGQPYKWAGPVTVNLDQGPLGHLSKTQADALALDAMNQWTGTNIPGSGVQFLRGPDLSEDHGEGSSTNPEFDLYPPHDGKTAVIYDQHGSIIETLGAGASLSVIGFAGPVIPDDYSPAPLIEGIAVLNGRFTDDNVVIEQPFDIPAEEFRGAFIHEIGHMLNMDHSQIALQHSDTGLESGTFIPGLGGGGLGKPPDHRGRPTMFPIVLPDISSLEMDDKAWIRELYPAPGYNPGSISGIVTDFDGEPVSGMNIIAFSADDPTSMISCVTGYTDADPTNTATGKYRIPGLPPGSVWVVDSEPISDAFTGGSKVGPQNPPVAMPGPPEFLNEPGIETQNDPTFLSTAFAIPTAPGDPHISDVNLRFNDFSDVDFAFEVENGNDPLMAQKLEVTPGKLLQISGYADPNEAGATYYPFVGNFVDIFEVNYPAGLELNLMFTIEQDFPVDVWVLEESPGNPSGDFIPLTGTGSLFGESLSLYMDSSRMGAGAGAGKFYFAAVTPDPQFGGRIPGPTNYIINILFTVSDRDAVVVKGTQTGVIDPAQGTIRILGRGFKDVGGPPAVTFSTPGIRVDGVTFINSNTLDVAVTPIPGLQPGANTAIQVTNQPLSGGFAGRRTERIAGEPSDVRYWELY